MKKLIWPLVALAVLLLINLVLNPGFFAVKVVNGHLYGSLIDILFRATPLTLTALGMTLVIATGGVDLSVGSVAAIAAAVASLALQKGFSFPMVLLISLSAACAVGLWTGLLVSKFKLQPIIATLIAMVAGRGLAQLLVDGQVVPIDGPAAPAFTFLGSGYLFSLPFSLTLAAIVLAAFSLLIRKTASGLFIEAVGSNLRASRIVGIPQLFVTLFVYAVSATGAGLSGLVSAANIQAVERVTGLTSSS